MALTLHNAPEKLWDLQIWQWVKLNVQDFLSALTTNYKAYPKVVSTVQASIQGRMVFCTA
jgi:hypothetical protein